MAPMYEQGTNLHHGLLLAAILPQAPGNASDAASRYRREPTAHLCRMAIVLLPSAMPDTLRSTVRELDKIGRLNAEVTFFRLGDDPGLKQFLEAMARRVDGKVVAPDARDLGAAVVNEFLHSRQPHFPSVF